MKKILLYPFMIVFFVTTVSVLRAAETRISAFCGAASKPAMEEAAEIFEEKTGIKVDLHFSGSGTTLSQTKISRRGDLYIPGTPDYMVRTERKLARSCRTPIRRKAIFSRNAFRALHSRRTYFPKEP